MQLFFLRVLKGRKMIFQRIFKNVLRVTVLAALFVAMNSGISPAEQKQAETESDLQSAYSGTVRGAAAMKDGYIPMEFKDLSKMYWAVGKFDYNNNTALDNFLHIHECDLYKRYHDNEFEWQKVRESGRQYIQSNLSRYPTKFEIVVPVFLGEYDIVKEEFGIASESVMRAITRIDVQYNGMNPPCGEAGTASSAKLEIEEYPRNVIVYLNRPFTLTRLPVPQELAAVYIDYADGQRDSLPIDLRRPIGIRTAFLRLKVSMVQYKQTVMTASNGFQRAVILTQLDGIEVYADPGEERLLFQQEIRAKKRRRVKKQDEPDPGAAAQHQEVPGEQQAPVPVSGQPEETQTPVTR